MLENIIYHCFVCPQVYRERNKVTPENVTCAYYKKKEEPGLLFPVFTRDLYVCGAKPSIKKKTNILRNNENLIN